MIALYIAVGLIAWFGLAIVTGLWLGGRMAKHNPKDGGLW